MPTLSPRNYVYILIILLPGCFSLRVFLSSVGSAKFCTARKSYGGGWDGR